MDAYAEYLFGPVKFQAHDTVHCAEITVDVVTEIKVKKVT